MAKKIKVCYKGDTSPYDRGYFDDVDYLKWLIDYYCVDHDVIRVLIKICEIFTKDW